MYWGAFIMMFVLWATIAPTIKIPRETSIILQAVYIVTEPPRIVNATWAVTNEICCYVLIGLGVTRSRQSAFWALIASTVVTVAMYLSSFRTLNDMYFPIAGAFLPFAVGGFLVHQVQRMRATSQFANLCLLGFGAAGIVACMAGESISYLAGRQVTPTHILFITLLPASAAIIALYRIKPPARLRSLDDLIGRFSYPIYLLHEPVGIVAWTLGLPYFAGTLLLTIATSAVFLVLIDNPVNRIRSVVRRRKRPRPDSDYRDIDKAPGIVGRLPT
jgi:peptidoglycan/LPS O-acetylase OafA/YrhL